METKPPNSMSGQSVSDTTFIFWIRPCHNAEICSWSMETRSTQKNLPAFVHHKAFCVTDINTCFCPQILVFVDGNSTQHMFFSNSVVMDKVEMNIVWSQTALSQNTYGKPLKLDATRLRTIVFWRLLKALKVVFVCYILVDANDVVECCWVVGIIASSVLCGFICKLVELYAEFISYSITLLTLLRARSWYRNCSSLLKQTKLACP